MKNTHFGAICSYVFSPKGTSTFYAVYVVHTNQKYFFSSVVLFLPIFLDPILGFIFLHRTFYIHLLIFFRVSLPQLEYKIVEDGHFCLSYSLVY